MELGNALGHHFPFRFGANVDVHPYLNLRISVYASEGNYVNIAVVNAAKSRAAATTKLKTEFVIDLIGA